MSEREPGGQGSLALGLGLHLAVAAGASATVWLDRRIRRSWPAAPPVAIGVVSGAWYAALHVLERRKPFRSDWVHGDGDVRTDLAFVVSGAAMAATTATISARLTPGRRSSARLDRLPAALAVAGAIGAFDLGHYWIHRLGHEWGPAWRFHSVHHSARRLYWLNATRFHAGDSLVDGTVEGAVVGLLGLGPERRLAYQAVRSLYGQLQHANINLRSGPADRLFSTPDLHRWHHSVVYDEGNTNYGAVTSIWDQCFGSYYRPGRSFDGEIGVGGMPAFPSTWAALEAAPFRWSTIGQTNGDIIR